jgi:hypothetical protein
MRTAPLGTGDQQSSGGQRKAMAARHRDIAHFDPATVCAGIDSGPPLGMIGTGKTELSRAAAGDRAPSASFA